MFSNPGTIVPQLHIAPGSVIADLGAGVGAYSFELAAATGPAGKVYACDVQKDMLVRIENEARERHIDNIQTVHSNVEMRLGTKLRDASVDWVVVANVLFQIEDRTGFAAEIARILKPGGSLLVVDWSESFGNLGPREDHVISSSAAEQLFAGAGLSVSSRTIDAGSHHYALVFNR